MYVTMYSPAAGIGQERPGAGPAVTVRHFILSFARDAGALYPLASPSPGLSLGNAPLRLLARNQGCEE
jgi:hypothetical protein